MGALELEVYEIFKTSLGEEKAGKVIQLFDYKVEDKFNQKKETLVTKEDISNLKQEISTVKVDLIKWMFGFWVTLVLMMVANWFLKR